MTGRDASPGTLSAIGQRVVCPFQSERVSVRSARIIYDANFKVVYIVFSSLTFETEYVPEFTPYYDDNIPAPELAYIPCSDRRRRPSRSESDERTESTGDTRASPSPSLRHRC